MKKLKFALASLFLVCSVVSKAQFVNIPDAGFVSFLQYTYPTCMSGSMMDTTCADIVNETDLSIPSSYNISNCFGVQFFDNIDTLNLNYHPITSLPHLPMDLLYLGIGYCNVSTITNFPTTLEKIEMMSNNLTSIPPLPPGLKEYYRSFMSGLPAEVSLPSTLEIYYINSSGVTNLAPLPSTLKNLAIGGNVGINIPVLPAGLETLGIHNLNLTSLPPIPIKNTAPYSCATAFSRCFAVKSGYI